MRVAVIGTGISGMLAANLLSESCELTVFEANDRLGGHTHTIDVGPPESGGRGPAATGNAGPSVARRVPVDTGFIVFNQTTYPNFCALLKRLGVTWHTSDMSFSVRNESSGLEYNGTDWNGILAQRSNALRPGFWRMLADIARFYREAPALLEGAEPEHSIGEYLERGGYSERFLRDHLFPMIAAVWSAPSENVRAFPAVTLVRFFANHGFLQLKDRPPWLALDGGSRAYVEPLCRPFADRIRLGAPVRGLRRVGGDVEIDVAGGARERFERVVVATHADQALRMLSDADDGEREVLGAFRFQKNDVVLHTDPVCMPRRRRAWASWNALVPRTDPGKATVSYWMNRLQGIDVEQDYFVSLNRAADVCPDRVLRRLVYAHPQFDASAVRAQARHEEIDGRRGIHWCGAYWRYGFHEDGVLSALRVAERMGCVRRPAERPREGALLA